MLQITRADYLNPAHQNALIHVLESYSKDPMGGGQPLSNYARTNLCTALAAFPGAFSLLAFDKETPVGLATCFQGFSTFQCKPLINIHDIAVIPAYRGQGIGQMLLAEVEKIAIEIGCCKITLEVLQGNLSARKAYEKFGFKGYELDPEMGHALFWEKKIG